MCPPLCEEARAEDSVPLLGSADSDEEYLPRSGGSGPGTGEGRLHKEGEQEYFKFGCNRSYLIGVFVCVCHRQIRALEGFASDFPNNQSK